MNIGSIMGTTQSKPGIFPSQPVSFKFEGISYQVTIQDVRLFPQAAPPLPFTQN